MCLGVCGMKALHYGLVQNIEGFEKRQTIFRQVEFDTDTHTHDCTCAHRHSH